MQVGSASLSKNILPESLLCVFGRAVHILLLRKELFETSCIGSENSLILKGRGSSIFFRLSNKDSFAAFRAEIVVFTLVLKYRGKIFIHFYPAYRIDRHTAIGT